MEYEKRQTPQFRIPDSIKSMLYNSRFRNSALKLTHFNFNLNINILQYPPKKFSISLEIFRKICERGLDNKNR